MCDLPMLLSEEDISLSVMNKKYNGDGGWIEQVGIK